MHAACEEVLMSCTLAVQYTDILTTYDVHDSQPVHAEDGSNTFLLYFALPIAGGDHLFCSCPSQYRLKINLSLFRLRRFHVHYSANDTGEVRVLVDPNRSLIVVSGVELRLASSRGRGSQPNSQHAVPDEVTEAGTELFAEESREGFGGQCEGGEECSQHPANRRADFQVRHAWMACHSVSETRSPYV